MVIELIFFFFWGERPIASVNHDANNYALSVVATILRTLSLCRQKLVVKPDQLIKRRGKLGLIAVGVDFQAAKQWVMERMNKDQAVSGGGESKDVADACMQWVMERMNKDQAVSERGESKGVAAACEFN